MGIHVREARVLWAPFFSRVWRWSIRTYDRSVVRGESWANSFRQRGARCAVWYLRIAYRVVGCLWRRATLEIGGHGCSALALVERYAGYGR